SLHIALDGRLLVNGAGRIGFQDSLSNPFNAEEHTYDVWIRGRYCSGAPTNVLVESEGQIVVGDWDVMRNTGRLHTDDSVTVNVVSKGAIYVDPYSELLIGSGREVVIGSEGFLGARNGAQIVVEDGGTLWIQAGAILQISQQSALIVREGGRLIIDDGAAVRLWDGQEPDGRAVIDCYGTLEVNGAFNFDGNGYFRFHSTHELAYNGPEFAFSGMGRDFRFIELTDYTSLHLGSVALELSQGKIVYGQDAVIKLEEDAALKLIATRHVGSGSGIGIDAVDLTRLTISNCEFSGLDAGLDISRLNAPNISVQRMIQNTEFVECVAGLQLEQAEGLFVNGCTFTGGEIGRYAAVLDNIDQVRWSNTTVSNYFRNTSDTEEWGAIDLLDIPDFVMSGGSINNNDVGIYVPEYGASGLANRTNIVLINQATIADHEVYGIHYVKGGKDENDLDYGLVLMDCAKLLNNQVGIKGRDVLLQIDAVENSGTDDPAFWRSNVFQNRTFGKLFEICYVDRSDVTTVTAHGNYWSIPIPTEVDIAGMHLLRNAQDPTGCSGSYPSVLLDFADFVSAEPTGCPPPPPMAPTNPTSKDCGLETEGGNFVGLQESALGGNWNIPSESPIAHLQFGAEVANSSNSSSLVYQDAYRTYRSALAEEETTELARERFRSLAQVSETERANASALCQKYVDVSRILAIGNYDDYKPEKPEDREGKRGQQSKELDNTPSFYIYPNPVTDVLHVETKEDTGPSPSWIIQDE
ncbi:MAG: hypothetical protein AAGJ82_02555, partial [Bacteroidota bacterium]